MNSKPQPQQTKTYLGDAAKGEDFFKCYSDYAKALRTWFIAYGLGMPILFMSNSFALRKISLSPDAPFIVWCFLIGVLTQVTQALLYKNTMRYLYKGEVIPKIKDKLRYKISHLILEFYWLEATIDVITAACFILATLKAITILL
ncbi:MAG: hypothetical protein JSW17_02595 [Candidatus Omnitrophota bacterium]|nr:MAG: hypothetical protein JSW17_02595 [Candidatus Omnitrophota bacterium]